jgi:site-specific DNA recombinase
MWMGGNVPLGYDASERTLVLNPAEAETVRRIFDLYRELGCVRRVKQEADRLGLRTKCNTTADGTEQTLLARASLRLARKPDLYRADRAQG